jgi:hypothetical protein
VEGVEVRALRERQSVLRMEMQVGEVEGKAAAAEVAVPCLGVLKGMTPGSSCLQNLRESSGCGYTLPRPL